MCRFLHALHYMNKYITGLSDLTGAIAGDVCKYYISPSVACLSVLSSADAIATATQRRADRRRRRVYDCPTTARSRALGRSPVTSFC